MKIYYFDKITKEYLGFGYPQISPLVPGDYLIPSNATTLKPPVFDATKEVCTFTGLDWILGAKVLPLPENIVYLGDTGTIPVPEIYGATVSAIAHETLVRGQFVNLFTLADELRAQLADLSVPGAPATGFVLSNANENELITVYTPGQINDAFLDLIQGMLYYMDPTVPGGITSIAPVSDYIQSVGVAIDQLSLLFTSEIISDMMDKTAVTGILKGDGSDITAAVPNTDYVPVTEINSVTFDTSPTDVPSDEGTVSWNPVHHCLDIDPGVNSSLLQVGQEEWVHVKNISGIDIPTNFIVGVTGGSIADDTPTVGLVSSSATDGIATTLGMATSSIPNNGFGFVTVRGLVHGFDTSSYSAGSVLYLSDTVMGGVTDVRPIPPSYTFAIAYTLDSAVDGVVYVRFGSPDAGVIATDAAVASQDPTGFINNNAITSTYDPTARTITLTGDLRYVWRGRVDSFTSPWTSPAHGTTLDTNYYLYSDDGINFTWHTDVWEFSDLIISYVYYGTTNKVAAVETHGTMSWQAHEEFHTVIGTYKVSGATLGGYTAGSTTLKHPTVTPAVVKDEDILTTLPALPTGTYTHLYLTGADVNAFTVGATAIIPVLVNNPYYNQFVTPNWVQTLMTNNSYMSIWLVGVPVTADAGSQAYRYLWLQGQTNGTLIDQQNLFPQDLQLGQFAELFKEFVFCSKVIIRYTAGNWSITEVTALTGNRVVSVGSPSGAYLSTVTATAPLEGLGTVVSPLAIPASTALVDGYLSHTDWETFNAKESTNNKVTALTTSSTDTQYPSAKLVYDQLDITEPVIGLLYDVDGNIMYDANEEPIITAGLSTQYIRADKTYADFATDMGGYVNSASAATPNDTDLVATVASSVLKKITWTGVKAFLKSYFDTIYQSILGVALIGTATGIITNVTTTSNLNTGITLDFTPGVTYLIWFSGAGNGGYWSSMNSQHMVSVHYDYNGSTGITKLSTIKVAEKIASYSPTNQYWTTAAFDVTENYSSTPTLTFTLSSQFNGAAANNQITYTVKVFKMT